MVAAVNHSEQWESKAKKLELIGVLLLVTGSLLTFNHHCLQEKPPRPPIGAAQPRAEPVSIPILHLIGHVIILSAIGITIVGMSNGAKSPENFDDPGNRKVPSARSIFTPDAMVPIIQKEQSRTDRKNDSVAIPTPLVAFQTETSAANQGAPLECKVK